MPNPPTAWTPEPGIYYDVPAAKYHSCPYASNSRLGLLVPPSTPAKLKSAMEEPPKDKRVWKEGRVLHACVLEFERYEREYQVAKACGGTTQKGQPCKKTGQIITVDGVHLCETHGKGAREHPEAIIVSAKDDAMARGCRKSFLAHEIAGGFLAAPDARTEITIIWDDPFTGVRCKARIDWYSPTMFGGLPMDLKGARDASEREFTKQAIYNGYLRQSVLYRRALRSVDLPAETFAGVAIEKVPPYDLILYLIGQEATGTIAAPGEDPVDVDRLVTGTLRLWDVCQKSGMFPGYERRVHTMTTPEWAWSMIADQTRKIEETIEAMEAAA